MHLLNDLVFGPGELWNLTPGPAQSNSDMEHQVEDPLKRAVLGKGLVINFEARVTYKNDPTAASDKQISQAPDSYRFQRIDFTAEQLDYDPTTSSWQVAAHPDPDVAAVDGSRILWKYGSLTPLVPKPRILDPNTTWQELNAVGLKPAVAKRIVAFIQNNPGWTPKGKKDKKDQLLLAVKASEGKGARKPNADWDATAVYWT